MNGNPAVDVTTIMVALDTIECGVQRLAVGREALHHVRQLRMRFRFAMERRGQIAPCSARIAVAFPDKAPELYKSRKARSETPVDFIRRVYGPLIGAGFGKHHISRLDLGLYGALKHWLRNNKMPADLPLPTKSELLSQQIAALGEIVVTHTADQREMLRLRQARRRRDAGARA